MSELGLTDLVSHTINTGDNPPIQQPVRQTPFALHNKMEELRSTEYDGTRGDTTFQSYLLKKRMEVIVFVLIIGA